MSYSYRDNQEFLDGIGRYMKEAEVEEDFQDDFTGIVLGEVDESVRQVKAASDMGLTKGASIEEATDLDRLILKEAIEKRARIEQRDCTDADGSPGSYVVLSESGRQLGCHTSRPKAVAQLQAVEASKGE